MRRRVQLSLLLLACASLALATSSSHELPFDARVYGSSSTSESVLSDAGMAEEPTSLHAYGQKGKAPKSVAAESVTVHPKVFMEDIDGENEPFAPVPMIVLKRGQTYRVEQRYKSTNYAAVHTGFNKWSPTEAHPKGFWIFEKSDILHESKRSDDNQGEGLIKADEYPLGKCLISFWSHSEAVATDEEGSRYRYVPFVKWGRSIRAIQGRNTAVFTFEFKDKYTTATVSLYRLP
jgi:hypothetical protein